jgi:hypothetical protein
MRSTLTALAVRKEAAVTLAALAGIAVAAPFLSHQLVSGTIVNATLIVSVCLLGAREGLVIGLLPSSVALAVGLLPAVLAPMVTFIIISNAILVLTFDHLRKINYWVGVIAAALLKTAFLTATSGVVVNLLVNKQAASAVAAMMSIPQLVTALAGGLLAYGVLKLLGGPRETAA